MAQVDRGDVCLGPSNPHRTEIKMGRSHRLRMNGSSIRYRLRLPDFGLLPNGISRRTNSISMSDARGLDKLEAGRPSRPAISLTRRAPAPIVSRSGRNDAAGGISSSSSLSGSPCSGPAGSRTKCPPPYRDRVRKAPRAPSSGAFHSTPERIHGDQIALGVDSEDLAQVSRPQGTHRESFTRPAVQGSAGIEYRAIHHVQARSADYHA